MEGGQILNVRLWRKKLTQYGFSQPIRIPFAVGGASIF